MPKRPLFVAAAALTAGLNGSVGHAAQPPDYLTTSTLEVAAGSPARQQRSIQWRSTPPAAAAAAWGRLLQQSSAAPPSGALPRHAVASWDGATGVPHRIVLSGYAAPASTAAPGAAERAWQLLSDHLELLAPGSHLDDFELARNDSHAGLRTVAFEQRHHGMPVLGGTVSFRFKAGRVALIASEAYPHVKGHVPVAPCSADAATEAARAWLADDGFHSLTTSEVTGPLVLPVVRRRGVPDYRTVLRVEARSWQPAARFAVYVDALTAEPVARRQLLRFAEGTVLYQVPERYPGRGRFDFPAALAAVSVDGAPATTDEAGLLTFADGGPASVELSAAGPRVRVSNEAGAAASWSTSLAPGGSVTWSASDDEVLEAQLSAFIHVGRAKAFAKTLAPDMAWLDQQLEVNVNIDDRCNAFYDGSSINFFQAGGPCENTARVADVIYHEFGHGFHEHAMLLGTADSWDPALGEGMADYFASSITDDPGMGRGFYLSDEPLRDLDPPDREHVWPFDIGSTEHYTGRILGGALWDLRKALIAKHGGEEGKVITDSLVYQAMRHATDIPSVYVELLAADDDDGDLQNGTPNGCEINQALGAHGLRAMVVETTPPSVVSAATEEVLIEVAVEGLIASCEGQGVDAVELSWRRRDEPRTLHELDMDGGPERWAAAIPQQPPGTVVQYAVSIRLAEGTVVNLPENRAAPMFEMFVGDVVPLYCTNFETDPELEGWTHGLTSGSSGEGADDWQWDQPQGPSGSGDPTDAFSGTYVFGNDLGHGNYDGNYQPDRVNFALSPMVETAGFENVRLHYRRWLNVEDGYYDQATIYADEQAVWTNFDSEAGEDSRTHHRDRQWRFHDVDLSAAASDGAVQVRFEIASDAGLQFGGWTLDDVCIVGFEPPPEPVCGDGLVDPSEQCDDGNTESGDGCSSRCLEEPAPALADDRAILTPRGGCACAVGSPPALTVPAWLSWLGVVIPWAGARWRRRRRTPPSRQAP